MDLARLRRIARKPPGYIASRALEEILQIARYRRLKAAARGRGDLILDRILGDQREFALARTRETVLTLGAFGSAARATASDPLLSAVLRARAEAALRRSIQLFGDAPVEAGIPPRWNEDVRFGYGWPLGNARAINYVNHGRPSDVKVAWELSRLRHLVALGQAAVALDDDVAAAALGDDLRDWTARNPLGWSVNWSCGMEVALRAVNLICIDGLLVAGGREDLRRLIVPLLYQHGWYLRRNLEISDVNGNHYLADAVGLLWLGRYFDGIGESGRWMTTGRKMVIASATDQVLADGLDHEGSLPYHLLVLEMFLAARHALRERVPELDAAIQRMLDAAVSFVGTDGMVPDLGDDDGGRVLAFSDRMSRDARRVLALGGVIADHAPSRSVSGRGAGDDVMWLLGPDAVERLSERCQVEPPRRHFPSGGLVVLGSGGDRIVADIGPVGFRGRGGHGHLDAMSFIAHLDGNIVVRDSGTATYTGDPGLREQLRDQPAHSSVIVDGLRYATLGGPSQLWAVAGDSRPVVEEITFASHEHILLSTQRLPAAAGHSTLRRRWTWRLGTLILEDEVVAPAGSDVRHHLQLPDGVRRTAYGYSSSIATYVLTVPATANVATDHVERSERYGSSRSGLRAVVSYAALEGPNAVRWDVQLIDVQAGRSDAE